jgi:hypothetical protein
MTPHRAAHLIGFVACLTIVMYVALVVLAAGCASMPGDSFDQHDHHGAEESAHSSLCAWSCQMISQSGPVASVPLAVADLVATPMVLPQASTHSITPSALPSSRAPPFVSLG